jgi:transposase-like protein
LVVGVLSDLKQRGLSGRNLEVIVSDEAGGLVKAIQALYPRSPHQLGTFHKANDIGQHLVDKRHRRRIISDALYVFEGATETEVGQRLQAFCQKWSPKEPKAVRNFTRGLEDCLIYLGIQTHFAPCLKPTTS